MTAVDTPERIADLERRAGVSTNGNRPPERPAAGYTDTEWAQVERIYAEGRYEAPDEEPEPTSWVPVDLVGALDATDIEPPAILERSDGLCLLYTGRVHAFQGESESLKSWAALLACRQVIQGEGSVLFVDFEDDARGVVSRLQALGLRREEILARFVYIRPDEPLRTRHDEATGGAEDLRRVLAGRRFALAVVDGVTEAMTAEGLELISNTDVAIWMRRLPRHLARTGASVVVIDHLTKDRTNQGRYSIGAQHKLAGLDGAAYKFQLVHYFSRATGSEPVDGRAVITVEKDRPGYVRGRTIDDKVGMLHLTAYPDGGVSGSIEEPTEGGESDRKVIERILAYLSVYDGSSLRGVEANVDGKGTAIREALRWMTDPIRGLVRVELKGCAHLHWLTEAGRAWPEPVGTRDAVGL
jgi:hypothetical protein